MKRTSYILKGLLFVMVAVVAGLAFNFVFGLLGAGVVYAATAAAVAGEAVESSVIDDKSSTLNRPTISQKVTFMKPSRTPLDSIMRQAVKKNVKAPGWTYRYYAVDHRPFTDTVASAFTKSGDGSETAAISVDDINIWNPDDTALIRGSVGTDGGEVMLIVYDVDRTDGKIHVQALNNTGSGTTSTKQVIPSIAEDTVLTRLAPGKSETDAQTSSFQMLPTPTDNYLQYFMAQIEQSTLSQSHNKEVQYGWSDFARQQIYDFRATMELTFLFGAKGKVTDKSDGSEKYFTGGVTRFITSKLYYGPGSSVTDMTHDDLIDISKSVFASNAGSDTRVMFGGSGFTASVMKLKTLESTSTADTTIDYITKHLSGSDNNVKLGVKFKTIETNFGSIYYYYHPLFDEVGWTNKAVILDLDNLEKAVWKEMAQRDLDLVKSGQKNVKAKVIEEISALILRYPDTHAIVAPKA